MSIVQDLSLHRTLPSTTFDRLGQLLEQMAQEVGTQAIVLTEAVLSPIPRSQQLEQFTLLVSSQFSALLVGSPVDRSGEAGEAGEAGGEKLLAPGSSLLNVRLTFEPQAIALFISQLSELLGHHSQTKATLNQYCDLQPNDARLQTKFTLLLLSALASELYPNPDLVTVYPYVSVCQPVENALRQQVAHERLLNQLTTQIRQSLDLPVIIATVVEQVREFLQLDRLVIYQFEKSGVRREHFEQGEKRTITNYELPITNYTLTGCVTYEARSTKAIPSVLNYKEENCFIQNSQCWDKYRTGFSCAVADVEKAYILSPCLLDFFRSMQVRAIMITPIVLKEKLWGLLIAHQCTEPRLWLDNEKNLLSSISEQLAIAIHQAELLSSLKQEKQTLEQRVVERTQALYDALLAAQAASRAKSEFLSTMSHELRTPLTSVIGMSATLLRWPLGELSERQRQYLQIIHDNGEQLLSLINDILELSQIEAGKAALNISSFSLAALAEASIRSFSEKARRKTVNLTLDLKIKPAFHLNADPRRVGQILWNLLSNAIKFTPEGGMVVLRIWNEKDNAVLQVEDTGIGIREEQLPLLFEKFQQLDTPLRRRYEGTGLGLALTKQLVELHRGRIEVESTVGVGSIFTVWLPKNYE